MADVEISLIIDARLELFTYRSASGVEEPVGHHLREYQWGPPKNAHVVLEGMYSRISTVSSDMYVRKAMSHAAMEIIMIMMFIRKILPISSKKQF